MPWEGHHIADEDWPGHTWRGWITDDRVSFDTWCDLIRISLTDDLGGERQSPAFAPVPQSLHDSGDSRG
jgi:hypothetical protein